MTQDEKFSIAILSLLDERQRLFLQEGGSVLVQPAVAGMHVENPITVPGYNHDQIHDRLQWLARRGFFVTGGPAIDAVLLGCYFGGLTPAGRRMLSRAA
jgi:hypothetical protein